MGEVDRGVLQAAAEQVAMAVRQRRDLAGAQAHRRLAGQLDPAASFEHEMADGEAARAGPQDPSDLGSRRHMHAPWRAQLAVEEQRPLQPDGTHRVRQDIHG